MHQQSFSTAALDVDTSPCTTTARRHHQRQPIYVAATRQHVGKTSVSLALISGLQKRVGRVGFVKPVGQVS